MRVCSNLTFHCPLLYATATFAFYLRVSLNSANMSDFTAVVIFFISFHVFTRTFNGQFKMVNLENKVAAVLPGDITSRMKILNVCETWGAMDIVKSTRFLKGSSSHQ